MTFPQVGLNEWYHVSATYDGSVVRAYLNGEEVDSQDGSFLIRYDDSPVYIGYAGYGSEFFNGNIDNVELRNTALSQEEIQESMFTDSTGYQPDLVGHWKFNANDGSTLFDLSLIHI